jgi:hypothetical protein
MSDPYAPARIHRSNLILLAALAGVALTGIGPYPAIPVRPWEECMVDLTRIRVAGLLSAVILVTAMLALRRGLRGLAFERTALALPLLLVRSKWCLLLAGVALFSQATEAVFCDAADGSAPSRFRLRMLAGATASTLGWLVVLTLEGIARSGAWWEGAALVLLLTPASFVFFLGGCYQWLLGLVESSEELAAPHWGSLAALAASVMLYAMT